MIENLFTPSILSVDLSLNDEDTVDSIDTLCRFLDYESEMGKYDSSIGYSIEHLENQNKLMEEYNKVITQLKILYEFDTDNFKKQYAKGILSKALSVTLTDLPKKELFNMKEVAEMLKCNIYALTKECLSDLCNKQ